MACRKKWSVTYSIGGSFFTQGTWENRWLAFLLDRIVLKRPAPTGESFKVSINLREAVDEGLASSVDELADRLWAQPSASNLLFGNVEYFGPGDREGGFVMSSGARLRNGRLTLFLCPFVPWAWLHWVVIGEPRLVERLRQSATTCED